MSIVELTLTVENLQEVRARTQEGGEATGRVQLDPLRFKTVEVFADWLRQGRITQRKELEVLGTHLYETLFDDQIARFYLNALGNEPREQPLRIKLGLADGAGVLQDWPWEYLYYPDTPGDAGYFFSTRNNLILCRFRQLAQVAAPLRPEEGKLRVLFVVSKPTDLAPVAEQPVIDAIQKLADRCPIQLTRLTEAEPEKIWEALGQTRPHVLHFIGHGRYNRQSRNAEVALVNPDGSAGWVSGRDFAEYFRQERIFPRLVFLQLCEPAPSGEDTVFAASFAAMAPHLLAQQIQAVVAMQYPIPNDAAVGFSRPFYDKLSQGEDIDSAVQHGRSRLATANPGTAYRNRIFGTPVLYMSSGAGIIQPQAPATGLVQSQIPVPTLGTELAR